MTITEPRRLTADDETQLRETLAAYPANPGRSLRSGDHQRLKYLADLAYRNVTDIAGAAMAEGRNLLASEKRTADRLSDLADRARDAVASYDADVAAGAASYLKLHGDTPAARTASVGADLRTAIAEVRDGRSVAYVELEGRALAESGSGGYGVPTMFGSSVQSLGAKSIVLGLPGVRRVDATTGDRMRFPRFGPVTVGGVAEGAALTAAATDLDAIDITFQKFACYEVLSTELEEDFHEAALTALGDRMLADVARRVDIGLLQGTGASDCVGLFNQPGVSTTSVAALPTDFDKISEAVYQLELNDGTPTAWLMHPRSWRIYSQIKTGISSDKTTLLAPDPSSAAKTLKGLPVYTTSAISITSGGSSTGSIAALVDASQLVVVTRRPARLEVSRDVGFATDQVAIRCTTRVGLGVIDAAGGVSLLTDIRAS